MDLYRLFRAGILSHLPVIGMAAALAPAMAGASVSTTEPAFDERAALTASQEAIGRPVGDYTLRDTRRNPVRLADFRGKPLVINMIYTGCTSSCPTIVETLHRAVTAAQEAMGKDSFAVVTIGFDARADTPERMRAYAASRGVDLPNWTFLSGDRGTVDALASDIGFSFFPSPKGFDHLTQTTIVDEKGIIYRHVYGADFDPPSVVEHLKDLVYGRRGNLTSVDGLINRLKLFCTIYDPAADRYRFDYSIFISAGIGLVVLSGLGFQLIRILRRGHGPQHAPASPTKTAPN